MTEGREAVRVDRHGWTESAIAAFQARSIAFDNLQKAERALAVARADHSAVQRAYEREVDTMVGRRRALAAGTVDGGER